MPKICAQDSPDAMTVAVASLVLAMTGLPRKEALRMCGVPYVTFIHAVWADNRRRVEKLETPIPEGASESEKARAIAPVPSTNMTAKLIARLAPAVDWIVSSRDFWQTLDYVLSYIIRNDKLRDVPWDDLSWARLPGLLASGAGSSDTRMRFMSLLSSLLKDAGEGCCEPGTEPGPDDAEAVAFLDFIRGRGVPPEDALALRIPEKDRSAVAEYLSSHPVSLAGVRRFMDSPAYRGYLDGVEKRGSEIIGLMKKQGVSVADLQKIIDQAQEKGK